MKRLSRWWRCLAVVPCLLAGEALAQAPEPVLSTEAVEAGYSVADSTATPVAYDSDEVLARLSEAEATIARLKEQLGVQELPPQEDETFFGFLGDQWRMRGDPELELVNYSTSSAMLADPKPKKWYEKYTLRGYTQFRINDVLSKEDGSFPPHHVGDRSISPNQAFFIRRARLILAGDVSEHMYIYLQPDFAVQTPGSTDGTHFLQLRDWYADLYFDKTKIYRVRVGQSKVPYGWENLQSSSNRIALDRSDSFNSSVRNERDLGAFFYWTPTWAQDFFKDVLDMGLKGSGNYGVFGIGVHNGQGGSLAEQNENLHVVTRLTLPHVFENGQHMEVGVQAYSGRYTVLSTPISRLGVGAPQAPAGTFNGTTGNIEGLADQRVGGTFVWYPQPLGFQTEWNAGIGPALNAAQNAVEVRSVRGGYAMMMYRLETDDRGDFFPFLRWNYFEGGYRSERNAPYAEIREWETGCEWQLNPQMELTLGYTLTDRTNTTAINQTNRLSYGQFEGSLLRVQFQINY